jgi:tetratricopeptide (TPR) repeat protein
MEIAPDPFRSPQRDLHDLLQAELLHTIGAYGEVAKRLDLLRSGIEDPQARRTDWTRLLGHVADGALDCNKHLRALSLMPIELRRGAGMPPLMETEGVEVPPRHPYPGDDQPLQERRTHRWIVDYYATTAASIEATDETETDEELAKAPEPEKRLGRFLRQVNDPQRRSTIKTAKHVHRGHDEAMRVLGTRAGTVRAAAVLDSDLTTTGADALHEAVVEAFAQAHLCMHRAESYLSHAYADKMRQHQRITELARAELERSLVLNTFVYAVSRSVPWLFADSPEERGAVQDEISECRERLSPAYCMWVSLELSMLAMHRRAYALWLLGEPARAYRDFAKLLRFLRGARPQLDRRATRVPGAQTFVEGLGAIAEHHIGRIYRGQGAHKVALTYFRRALRRLDGWDADPEIGPLLRNSRWRVHLLISEAKAYYELGKMKACLLSYMLGYRAFLELVATESQVHVNFRTTDGIIAWLQTIIDDPEIDKREVVARLAPFVDQLETVSGPIHLRLMSADIILRLGHVLYMLHLPAAPVTGVEESRSQIGGDLAWRCMRHAATLDQTSTLIASGLEKIGRQDPTGGREIPEALTTRDLERQWPGGGGRFEESARVVEYILQHSLSTMDERRGTESGESRELVARDLMRAFLASTDSSNVKLAQVYRYLMKERPAAVTDDRAANAGTRKRESPKLELVCLRRYSSFFPFLPRPSAFGAPGGGYFVQVHDESDPFGIVVDPGPNFLDNLYRCGYSLDDLHMIVVTHDHADHLASLDALLSLIGYREMLMPRKAFEKERRLTIIGNESVTERYRFFNDPERRDNVLVVGFDRARELTHDRPTDPVSGLTARLDPKTLVIEPVATRDHRDAHGSLAQGFMLSVGEGRQQSRIFFTSDTGPELEAKRYAQGMPFEDAIDGAHVVVAHLSAVPHPRLRELAGLEDIVADSGLTKDFNELWRTAVEETERGGDDAATQMNFLLRQVQFGFQVRYPPEEEGAPPRQDLRISPLWPAADMGKLSEKHLYLDGVLEVADSMMEVELEEDEQRLLIIGELREELGSFRARMAKAINHRLFSEKPLRAVTADIGLKVRVQDGRVSVHCTTCDLDNDLVETERYHDIKRISEVCVKGENEAIFYSCEIHRPGGDDDPTKQFHPTFLEAVERYDPFAM